MLRYKTQTRPGLVALYDIRPGNRAGLFLQPHSPHGAHACQKTIILPVDTLNLRQYRAQKSGMLLLHAFTVWCQTIIEYAVSLCTAKTNTSLTARVAGSNCIDKHSFLVKNLRSEVFTQEHLYQASADAALAAGLYDK